MIISKHRRLTQPQTFEQYCIHTLIFSFSFFWHTSLKAYRLPSGIIEPPTSVIENQSTQNETPEIAPAESDTSETAEEQTDPLASETHHICQSASDQEQIIQTTLDQNHSNQSKPERHQTGLEQILHPSFDQEQTGQSATMGLKTKEEKYKKILVQNQGTKQSQSHNSGSVAGPGALITELISEDEIETITLSERPALTIDVSPYSIFHVICFYKKFHDLECLKCFTAKNIFCFSKGSSGPWRWRK